MVDRSITKQIENIKRAKLCKKKIVSLEEFRLLKETVNSKTILVVDDDEVMRKALARIFEGEKYKVITASDGLELSKTLENTRLDLILLDIKLPWVDGFELCRILKSHHIMKHIPIIFISGKKSEQDIQKGFDCGCDDYITKPFDIDEITSAVNKLLLKIGP